jgi:hypothetical protein
MCIQIFKTKCHTKDLHGEVEPSQLTISEAY